MQAAQDLVAPPDDIPADSLKQTTKASRLTDWDVIDVPEKFADAEAYISCFFPLFLLETKQAIYRAKETEMQLAHCLSQTAAESRPDKFFAVTLQKTYNYNAFLFQGDLVLLYLDDKDPTEAQLKTAAAAAAVVAAKLKKNKKARASEITQSGEEALENPRDPLVDRPYHVLGIVENSTRDSITIRIVIQNPRPPPADATGEEIRRCARLKTRMLKVAEALNQSCVTWNLTRVMSLSTVYREFKGLVSLPDLYLRDVIIQPPTEKPADDKVPANKAKAKNSKTVTASEVPSTSGAVVDTFRRKPEEEENLQIPPTLLTALQDLYNDSQFAALKECLKISGVTLIQGPPGTTVVLLLYC
eukprot:Lankesteria_metandrocarpae@DN2585_c0_g1_i3.p1